MSRVRVQHVLRAPLVGGSELETASICQLVTEVEHSVVFLERFAGWEGRADAAFPASCQPRPVRDLERAMEQAPGLVHLQFPFLLVAEPAGHDSVLELTRLPLGRTLFTVHAAVNIPLVEGLHYVFHTRALAARLAGQLDPDFVTICPSLVPVPAPRVRRSGKRLRLLWVSRSEEGKFHNDLPAIVEQLLALEPELELRFVGRARRLSLPRHERVAVLDCPVADLAAEYAAADLFWYFPHRDLEETWCRTVTEAMSFGLPVVTASWGAMAEQLSGGAGWAVDEPVEVVDAVARLAISARRRERAGEVGRARALELNREARSTLAHLYNRLGSHA